MTSFVSGLGPFSLAAFANHALPLHQVGGFEIDGDFAYPHSPAISGATRDWATVGGAGVNGPFMTTDPSNSQNDTVFGGGSKEQTPDTWKFQEGPKPPGKDDLTRTYYASTVSGGTAYLWLAFERLDVQGDGDAHVNFELNQSTDTVTNSDGTVIPKRSTNDLLVIYDYSGGTGPVNVEVRTWSGSPLGGAWSTPFSLPAGSAYADINIGSIPRPAGAPFGGGTVEDRRFGEAGLNLTAIFNGAVPSCPGFARFWAKSRSSGESFNSELKDRVAPISIDLSTCPDLHVSKSASASTVNAGDNYSYTITAVNDGVAPATGVQVTDNLDDDLVVVSATYDNNPGLVGGTGNCSVGAGNAITCNVGTLAASDGDSTGSEPDKAVVTITVTATKEACGTVLNKAHVASSDEPANLSSDNDSAQVSVTVLCGDVEVLKTADASSVSAGTAIGYTLTVNNNGAGRADDVTLTDTLPTNAGLSWSVDGGTGASSCAIANGVLTCNFGSMNGGATLTVHISSPTTAASCGTVNNSAAVSTTNDGSDTVGPVPITVLCPDVHVLKTSNGTVSSGDTMTWTIVVSNDGSGTATNVTLFDQLPAGITWSEDSADCSIAGGILSCNFGNLASGATRTVHVSGTAGADDCGVLSNTANVSAGNESTADAADNSSTSTATVLCADVTIEKVADAGTVSAGEDIGYTITVHNNGTGRADDVTLTDTLPTNAGLSWSVDGGTGASSCAIASGVLTCNFGSMNGGATLTVHITSPTTSATCGTVNNSASVSTSNDGGGSVGPIPIVVLCPDTSITKVADDDSVNAGSDVGFTITVSNTGLGKAFDVEVSDDLPGDLDWSIDGGTGAAQCSIANGTLSCDFGTMNGGTSKTVHITATTDAADCGTINNTAELTVSNDQSDDASDSVLVACPDIDIVKSGPQQAHIGDTVTYLMAVTVGEGDVALDNVAVSDPLCDSTPAFTGGDTDGDGLLDLTEVWGYTCTHVVIELDGDPVPNTATAVGDSVIEDDNRHVEAEDSWEVDIVHPAISIDKTASPVSGEPGTSVTYTYVVTNIGDTPLINIVVTDDKLGEICTIATLGVAESKTCTKTTTLSAAGSIVNIGTAVGTDDVVPRRTVRDTDDATVTIVLGRVIIPKTGARGTEGVFQVGTILVIIGGFLVWIPRRKRENES